MAYIRKTEIEEKSLWVWYKGRFFVKTCIQRNFVRVLMIQVRMTKFEGNYLSESHSTIVYHGHVKIDILYVFL